MNKTKKKHGNITKSTKIKKIITNTWFERVSMAIIIINCFTLGMYQPCADKVGEGGKLRLSLINSIKLFFFCCFNGVLNWRGMGRWGEVEVWSGTITIVLRIVSRCFY